MAEARRTIEMVFAGTDRLSDTLTTITRNLDSTQKGIDKFATPIASATEQLLKLEAAVAAVGVALAAYALNQAVSFQDATTELNKVLGGTEEELGRLAQSAIQFSNRFGESAVNVQKSFSAFASAGFAGDELETLTKSILEFARVSELDAAEGTEALVRILKGFNAEAAETPAILDLINENTNKYATNTKQLTEALARASAIGRQSGFTIAETVGVLTPIIEVFQDSEIAATAFNTVMQRLISDTSNVREGLAALGVSQKDANGNLRQGKDILLDVQRAFQGVSDVQKPFITNLLAGTEQAAKFGIVFDGLDKTAQATADSLAGVGRSVQDELAKRTQDASYQMGLLRESFNNAAIIIGSRFLPGLTNATSGLQTVGLAIQQLGQGEAFQVFAERVNQALGGLGEEFRDFAASIPAAFEQLDFGPLLAQIEALGVDLGQMFSGVDLTTPEGLADALQTIVDLGAQVIAFNRGLVEGLTPVVQLFTTLIDLLGKVPPGFAEVAGVVGGVAIGLKGLTAVMSGVSTAVGVLNGAFKLLTAGGAGSLLAVASAVAVFATQTELGQKTVSFWGQAISDFVSGPALSLEERLGRATEAMDTVGQATQVQVKAVDASTVAWQSYIGQINAATGQIEAISGSTQKAAEAQSQWAEGISLATDATLLFQSALSRQSDTSRQVFGELELVDGVYRNLSGSGATAASAVDRVAESQENAAEKAARLALESEKLELEWEKLRSGERELLFKLSADLQIEQFKAQAEQFKAVIESIDTAIESTGETLLGLAKLLIEADKSIFLGGEIRQLLKAEEERRRQTFELQKELVDAQVRYLEISSDRLARGDALIKISADGLEPELKAVLFRIIELAHVEASGSAAPLLLGIPSL